AFGLAGDDLRQRRFARAGRPVKNQRLDAVGLDGAAEQLALAEDVRLSGVFIKVARAHSRGEGLATESVRRGRGLCFWQFFSRFRKQIIARHALKLTSARALPKRKISKLLEPV